MTLSTRRSWPHGAPALLLEHECDFTATLDADGRWLYASAGYQRQFAMEIRAAGPDGVVRSVAGTATAGFSGDGHQADQAKLFYPNGIAAYRGLIYLTDNGNNRIRRISPGGVITRVVQGVTIYED